MLNFKKTIASGPENKISPSITRFNILPRKGFYQTLEKKKELGNLSIVFEKNQEGLRYNSLVGCFLGDYRVHGIYKKKKTFATSFKTTFNFLINFASSGKLTRFCLVKKVKGGFIINFLGYLSFVPKSQYNSEKHLQTLLKHKIFKKRPRNFTKNYYRINLVSSLKTRENNG